MVKDGRHLGSRIRPQVTLLPRTLFTITLLLSVSAASPSNPSRPVNQNWQVYDLVTGRTLSSSPRVAPLWSWFPDLYFDLGILYDLFVTCSPY